jgi:nucleotide-binding universal stress UspA family protein
MKRILVPTDFSKLSGNALNYTVELAEHVAAEIVLIHSYSVPLFTEDSPIVAVEQLLQEDALQSLEDLKKLIERSNPGLKISYSALTGDPADVISTYADTHPIDLIVIGAQGGGYIRERILGSTASKLIRKTKVPVMVVDKEVNFKVPEKIVLAVDLSKTDDQVVLKPLKQLAQKFKSHICILNIFSETEAMTAFGQMAESFRLEKALKETLHTFFEVQHPDVVKGINQFVTKQGIDMVAVVSRKHSLIGRVFREPVTNEMTFHSLVPLLILHE